MQTLDRQIGPYRLTRKVGEGGMGQVYEATHAADGTRAAVKVVAPGVAPDEPAARRLLHEAKLAAGLDHPHIVRILSAGLHEGLPYVAMEYVDGETLRARLERSPLGVRDALSIAHGVAEALDVAHRAGFVHRDIKPSNVLLGPGGQVKVADFGLAKRFVIGTEIDGVASDRSTDTELTRSGAIVGTVSYMSPEQTRGEPLDGRSDLFSLGCVLYEAATRRRPFDGASALATLHEIVTVDPLPPSLLDPGLPPALDRILARALAKDAAHRYRSGSELAEDLRSILDSLPTEDAGRTPGGASDGASEEQGPLARGSLPAPPTSFIGRVEERETVRNLLAAGRVVTLVGAGGCGKSRLALQVARDVQRTIAHGVWHVDLAPVAPVEGGDSVAPAVASVLDIREQPGKPLLEVLKAALASRAALLVLDNCEHLAEACAHFIASLVPSCPNLRVIATSRTSLGAPGETVWRVPSLGLPSPDAAPAMSPEDLMKHDAVRLFVDRARSARPGFVLEVRTAPRVVEICLRLDGIPLAIELAAARVNVLSIDQIRDRLDDRFRLLAGAQGTPGEPGAGARASRQRTLRLAVDWSHDLLPPAERVLFARLGAFAGGIHVEAVEAVCTDDKVPQGSVLDRMASLVDQSMVVLEEDAAGSARYRLLETLRQYAVEKLREADEEESVRERHASFFTDLASRAESELEGAGQTVWMERLEHEHDNLRAALRWWIRRARASEGLRLGASLDRFWWVRGHWTEGEAWLGQVLSLKPEGPCGTFRAQALRSLGRLLGHRGDYAAAEARHLESLREFQDAGDELGMSMAMNHLGMIHQAQGRYESARSHFKEALRLQLRLGNRRSVAISRNNLGRLAEEQGDYAEAKRQYEESLRIRRTVADRRGMALSLQGIGNICLLLGDPEGAEGRLLEAIEIQRELNDRQGSAYTLLSLASLALERGDAAAARSHLAEGLSIHRALGDRLGVAVGLDLYALLALVEKRPERAIRLNAAADTLFRILGAPRTTEEKSRSDQLRVSAEAALEPERTGRARAEGQAMGMAGAVRYAVESDS